MCAVFTGELLHATLPLNGERALAPSNAVALIGDCRVSGVLVKEGEGVAAELEIVNGGLSPTNINFTYTVTCTPEMNPMSRMAPSHTFFATGSCAVAVASGATQTEKITVSDLCVKSPRGSALKPANNANTSQVAERTLKMLPDGVWEFAVSRGDNGALSFPGGGTRASVTMVTNRLESGTMLLASATVTNNPRATVPRVIR